jgi:hypothetical protein
MDLRDGVPGPVELHCEGCWSGALELRASTSMGLTAEADLEEVETPCCSSLSQP